MRIRYLEDLEMMLDQQLADQQAQNRAVLISMGLDADEIEDQLAMIEENALASREAYVAELVANLAARGVALRRQPACEHSRRDD